MNEDDALLKYGLHPAPHQLGEIRHLLLSEIHKERAPKNAGNTELMKLYCVQLFNEGTLDDILLIWQAKTASMDADASIDIQLLCGRGIEETKGYLASRRQDDHAQAALARILTCEESGDFDDYFPVLYSAQYDEYYYGEVDRSDGK